MRNITPLIKRAFILSPFKFFGFQLRWFVNGKKYKNDGHAKAVARHTVLEHYKNDIIVQFEKKYSAFIQDKKEQIETEYNSMCHDAGNNVWVCWLQGIDSAPPIVQKCFDSVVHAFQGTEREVVLITNDNYADYVDLPEYIIQKYKSGKIKPTLFSDILRINLLINLGGVWLDPTILITDKIPDYMLNSALLIPQTVHEETMVFSTRIVSWFISARRNSKILLLTRELLYKYWKQNDEALEYLLVYYFLEISIKAFPDEWEKVPVFPFVNALMVADNLQKPYSKELYEQLTSLSPFQKLTHRFLPEAKSNSELTILDHIYGLTF